MYIPLIRDGVWLRASGRVLTGWATSGGTCEVLAPVSSDITLDQVEAALEQKFGVPPTVKKYKSEEHKSWQVGERRFSARITAGELKIFMAFPEPGEAEVAAAREAEAKAKAEHIAAVKAATVFSPAAEFGGAAVACMAALGPKALDVPALEREGWSRADATKTMPVYQRAGTAVRIMAFGGLMPGGQCIVDGYAQDQGQFNPIRDAVRDALEARTGKKPNMPSPVVPNGQGFVVGDMMMILSTEPRINGLSVRITSARVGGI